MVRRRSASASEKLRYLNAEPIDAISERWIDNYTREAHKRLHPGRPPGEYWPERARTV